MASLFCLAASQLLFHLGARLLYSSSRGPFLIPANPSSNKRSLYLLAACLSSAFSCFHEFAIRRAMGMSLQPGNIGFSSPFFPTRSTERVAREGRDRLLYNVFPECPRLTSEFPILPRSRFRRGGGTRDVFAHLIRRLPFASCC